MLYPIYRTNTTIGNDVLSNTIQSSITKIVILHKNLRPQQRVMPSSPQTRNTHSVPQNRSTIGFAEQGPTAVALTNPFRAVGAVVHDLNVRLALTSLVRQKHLIANSPCAFETYTIIRKRNPFVSYPFGWDFGRHYEAWGAVTARPLSGVIRVRLSR